jgi:uncharacterized protein
MNSESAYTRSGRIEAIDVLRGFTLFGIIVVHFLEQYYAGIWPEQYSDATTPTLADKITGGFISLLISGKFYMIFSFLFGLSFYMQFSKSGREKNFTARFAWRLTILFIIGFIHHLHYRGDILTIYAILGFGLLLCYRLPDNYLLVVALFLILNIPAFIARAVDAIFPAGDGNPFSIFPQQQLLDYMNTLRSGSYMEVLKANFFEFAGKMQIQVLTGRLYITLGLFLLGIYVGRKNIFNRPEAHIPLFKKLLKYGGLTVLSTIVFSGIVFGGSALAGWTLSPEVNWLMGGFVIDIFNAAMATIYVATVIVLFQKTKWQKRLMIFSPVGKMGLTTYLMQSVFGTIIFFNFGFGLFMEIGALISVAIGVALFVVQIIFARIWFNYFTQGPIEWIWRNLTYLQIQPIAVHETEIQQAKIN